MMREYGSAEIRNVAVVGHGGAGKTSLVDALCFASGTSKRRGSVAEGTALTSLTPEKAERGFSTTLGCAHAEWDGCKVNLLDTPGRHDFQGDAVAGLAAADGALLVVGATDGVRALLTELVQLMPSAYEMEELHALRGAEGREAVEIHASDDRRGRSLSRQTVARKEGENTLVSNDGATCRVKGDVYEKVQVGEEHACVWQDPRADSARAGQPRPTRDPSPRRAPGRPSR